MRRTLPLICLAIATTLGAGCQNQAAPPAKLKNTPSTPSALKPNAAGQISGQVMAPAQAGLVASGAGIVASGGGNIVASGGGNVVAGGAGNYRLSQAPSNTPAEANGASAAEQPLAGTEVYLADAQGQRVAGLKASVTGKDGNYLFTGLDPAKAKGYQVIAMAKSPKGQAITLRSLANVGGQAKLSLASTHATLAALKEMGGQGGELFGQLKLDRFASLTEGFAKHLREDAPSIEDPEAWAQWGTTQLESDAELKASLTEVASQLKAAAEELKTALKQVAEEAQNAIKDAVGDALNGLTGKR